MMIKKVCALLLVLAVGAACAPAPALPRPDSNPDSRAPLPLVVHATDTGINGISGIVRTQGGTGLGGTVLRVVGTPLMAQTDLTGRFQLEVPAGVYALRTVRIGYDARTDSVRVPDRGGLRLELPLREAEIKLETVCACDPMPALRLEIRASGPSFQYAIVTTQLSEQPPQRDSLSASDFVDGVALRTVLAMRLDGNATVEIRSPGYRVWRTRARRLPATIHIVLEPETGRRSE